MNRLSAKTQLYIGIALIVVASVAVVFLLILPVYQEAADLESLIDTEETNLATAQALLARRQSAKAQSAANEVELMRVANQVPDSPQLPSVIIEIQDLANSAELSLETIAPSDMVSVVDMNTGLEAGYSEVPLQLRLRGDWEDLIDFFRAMAALDRGVRVREITLTYVTGEEDQEAYMDVDVRLSVYVMAAASTNRVPSQAVENAGTATPAANQ